MSPSDELLRPALELAFAVAFAGTKLRPPIPPPPQLRPYLKFQKLPNGALPVVRMVVEDDDEFRVRTARVATEELAGRLGVVWLTRGDGWVEEVQRLVEAALLDEPVAGDDAAVRKADRRREAAEQAAHRAQAEIAVARADADRERERRVDLERRLRELEHELVEQRRTVERVTEEARSTKARGSSAVVAADELRAVNQQLRERVAELERQFDDALAARLAAESERDAARSRVATSAAPGPARPELTRAIGALNDTAGAIRQLAGALEVTATALATPTASEPLPDPEPAWPTAPTSRRSGPRRAPLAIPGGLFGDSDAVAAHLVRQPDVTLVVDGYNVAKLGWPTLSLEQQRESCLDALETLVRRTGVRTVVFFDGADLPSAAAARRRLLRVRFTPSGTIADDAIRAHVAELPADRPVVVATNDQAIVRDVRADGANVLSSEQLLSVLRR